MNTRSTKTAVEEEEVDPPDDPGEDDDDDDDGDDDDEDEDSDEDDDEMTAEHVARDVTQAIRDALENHVSADYDKRRILLTLDDDTRWVLTVKAREP